MIFNVKENSDMRRCVGWSKIVQNQIQGILSSRRFPSKATVFGLVIGELERYYYLNSYNRAYLREFQKSHYRRTLCMQLWDFELRQFYVQIKKVWDFKNMKYIAVALGTSKLPVFKVLLCRKLNLDILHSPLCVKRINGLPERPGINSWHGLPLNFKAPRI